MWYLKQLIPLTYRTKYTALEDNTKHFCVWKMWMGKVFNVDDYVVR